MEKDDLQKELSDLTWLTASVPYGKNIAFESSTPSF